MTEACSIQDRYKRIAQHLDSILIYLEELMEDPIFINAIHGEQDIAIEQAADLIETLHVLFSPQEEAAEPTRDSDLYDVT